MRKKTLVALISLIVAGLASIAGGYLVGAGLLGQEFVHFAFYGFAFGSPLLAAATLGLTTLLVQGVIKRNHNKNGAKENLKNLAMIKDKSKSYRYSKNLSKYFSYLTQNHKAVVFGPRTREMNSDAVRRIDANVYRREFLNDKRAGKIVDKEMIKLDKGNKLNPLATAGTQYGVLVVPSEGGITFSDERIPNKGLGFHDRRNEIQCFYPKTKAEYFEIAQLKDSYKDIKNSSGIKTYKDYGYETYASFAGDVLPSVFVKSNAEGNMEEYELMFLKDIKQKVSEEKKENSAFPMMLYKKHYGDEKKCLESATKQIRTVEELNERIDLLTRKVKNSKSVACTHEHYVYSDYRKTTIKDPNFDKEEQKSDPTMEL